MTIFKFIFVFLMLVIVIQGKIIIHSKENVYTYTNKRTGAFGDPKWWETSTVYQIYPASFKDNIFSYPGYGDITGIIEKMSYFNETGVTAILLSPFLLANSFYEGDDIVDFEKIDMVYNGISTVQNLTQSAKDYGIKLLIDFVPNHTSDQHKWFKSSINRDKEYSDFYIWHNGTVDKEGKRSPPNNWKSMTSLNGSAWTWNDKRGQWYLHQFSESQPDLNYRNPKVVDAIKGAIQYWLKIGVDGFCFRAPEFLFEDAKFRDEPIEESSESNLNDYDSLNHIYTKDLNETYEMIYEFRELIENFTIKNKVDDRILIVDIHTTMENSIKYCVSEDEKPKGAHFFINYDFINNLSNDTSPVEIMDMVTKWWGITFYLNYTWMLGNYDSHRLATRLGSENVDGYNMLLPLFLGMHITYNGEEIGMENGPVSCKEGRDPIAVKDCSTFAQTSRDFQRTPFHWDSSLNAGFNIGHNPWLPVNPNFKTLNLEAQKNISNSHYRIYKKMQDIKKMLASPHRSISWSLSAKGNILQCYRFASDVEVAYSLQLVFNLGNVTQSILLEAPENSYYKVLLVSGKSSRKIGDRLVGNTTQVMAGHEAFLLSGPWLNNRTEEIFVDLPFLNN